MIIWTVLKLCALLVHVYGASHYQHFEVENQSSLHGNKNTRETRVKRQVWDSTPGPTGSSNTNINNPETQNLESNKDEIGVSYDYFDSTPQYNTDNNNNNYYRPPPPPPHHWGGYNYDYNRPPPPPPPHDRWHPRCPDGFGPPHHGPPPPHQDYYRSASPPPPPHHHWPYHGPPGGHRLPPHGYHPPPPRYDYGPQPHEYQTPPPFYDHGPPDDHGSPHGPSSQGHRPPPDGRGPPYDRSGSSDNRGPPNNHGPPPDNRQPPQNRWVQPERRGQFPNPQESSSQISENEQLIKNLKLIFGDARIETLLKNGQTTQNNFSNEHLALANNTKKVTHKGGQPLISLDANNSDLTATTVSPLPNLYKVVLVTPER